VTKKGLTTVRESLRVQVGKSTNVLGEPVLSDAAHNSFF